MRRALLCILTLGSFSLQAQITTFQKTYRGVNSDIARCINTTADGGYIVTGRSTNDQNTMNLDLVRLDNNGDLVWAKTLGGIFSDDGVSVVQTSDGGFVTVGSSFSYGSPDIYVLKTDASGSVLWIKTYGSQLNDLGTSVQQTKDGGLIIAGTSVIDGWGALHIFLVRTDADGNLLWSKSYGWQQYRDLSSWCVAETADEGFIVTGYANSSVETGGGTLLLKTDGTGGLEWCRALGGDRTDLGYSVKTTADGGYILGGLTTSFHAAPGNQYYFYLIKTDSSGETEWSQTYGDTAADRTTTGYDVYPTSDGGYAIAGQLQKNNVWAKPYVVKTDGSGNVEWAKTYGGELYFGEAYSIRQTNDGGYIIAGSRRDSALGKASMYFIKTDANGNSGCYDSSRTEIAQAAATTNTLIYPVVDNWGAETTVSADTFETGKKVTALCFTAGVQALASARRVRCYPNPTAGVFTIEGPGTHASLEVFNTLGVRVYSAMVPLNKASVDLSYLPKGMYIYRIICEDHSTDMGRVIFQ